MAVCNSIHLTIWRNSRRSLAGTAGGAIRRPSTRHPRTVAECMARMLFAGEKDITKSVIDCCAGTGTLLLAASNFSVNIHAAEISLDLCLMLEVNAYLFIPWLVKPAPWLTSAKELPKQVSELDKNVEEHSHRKRVYVGNREIEFKEQNGQLLPF